MPDFDSLITTTGGAAGIGGLASATAPKQTEAMKGLDKDAFMKLLVAQLRYQNPMSPADGQEYLAQAAQMAMVERLDGLAKAQSEAVAYQQVILSSALVGREVTGTAIGVADKVSGVVDSLHFKAGVPTLVVAGQEIPINAVERIAAAGAPAAPTTTHPATEEAQP